MAKGKFKVDTFFFGEDNQHQVSNKYFTFKHVVDNDNIIINTKNVRIVKGNYVLVIGDSTVVYLKPWQVKEAHNWSQLGDDFYLVKLNRNFFKPYTFKFTFDDLSFDGKVRTFDDLKDICQEQDNENMKVALGFMNF